MKCTLTDPQNKNTPHWIQKACDGKLKSVNPGITDYLQIAVSDFSSPPFMKITALNLNMGSCSASFSDLNGLFSLTGNVYTCDEQSHQFIIQKF